MCCTRASTAAWERHFRASRKPDNPPRLGTIKGMDSYMIIKHNECLFSQGKAQEVIWQTMTRRMNSLPIIEKCQTTCLCFLNRKHVCVIVRHQDFEYFIQINSNPKLVPKKGSFSGHYRRKCRRAVLKAFRKQELEEARAPKQQRPVVPMPVFPPPPRAISVKKAAPAKKAVPATKQAPARGRGRGRASKAN